MGLGPVGMGGGGLYSIAALVAVSSYRLCVTLYVIGVDEDRSPNLT